MTSLQRIVTKNIRSASPRCAIEKMLTRGLPPFVRKNAPTSIASPLVQFENPGDAITLFSRIARSNRSFRG